MNRIFWVLGILSVTWVTAPAVSAEETILPIDVQEYIENRKSCNQLAGEDYSDPSRAKMMAKELFECGQGHAQAVQVSSASVNTVDQIEKRLRKKYRKHPAILQAIDAAKDQTP